jgi:hypothetical protein
VTTPTLARDRQQAQAADRVGGWILQLADTLDHLRTNLAGKLTRTERAQIRRVRRLMLAAADGVSTQVLLVAILELASTLLVQVESWRRPRPVPRRRHR